MKRLNVDVEETRRAEKDAQIEGVHRGILICIALMEQVCDEKPSRVLSMLDMLAARVIHTLSKELKKSEVHMIDVHQQNVYDAIQVLKRIRPK